MTIATPRPAASTTAEDDTGLPETIVFARPVPQPHTLAPGGAARLGLAEAWAGAAWPPRLSAPPTVPADA